MNARKVFHEVTLVAFVRNEDGTRSICDIVETSYHYASYFTRRWMKDDSIVAIGSRAPGATFIRVKEKAVAA